MGSKGESVMETMNCKGCGKDKPVADMFVRGGRPIRTCRICRALQMGGGKNRVAKLADKVAAKNKRAPKVPSPTNFGDEPGLRIAIDPGFGVEGELDDKGYLQLAQRDVEGTIVDRIALSRAEFRQIAQTFAVWAA